jgi:hypothetical protein
VPTRCSRFRLMTGFDRFSRPITPLRRYPSSIGAVFYRRRRTSPDQLRRRFPLAWLFLWLPNIVYHSQDTLLTSHTMQFDLNEKETSALRKLLADAIEYDRYPLSPRVQTLKLILSKFLPTAAPLPSAGPPSLEPSRTPRSRSRRVR